ncbi:protein of unknown function [Modestobacter italicus]|uniref:Uncharacterized protein n=1 Tax=Modestobacter italicus (strain DSM 44449 / CECT 9708 / BC 501) TaxID=2732864 RepID=I4EVQ2_MODI5|nr:hypothetical protein [Modestobacter marinus]CCH87465.1 protein of unknown function [Modestobacter marinus]
MTPDGRRRQLDAARVRVELTLPELWVRYAALTGTGDVLDLDGFLHGLTQLEPGQQDVLAQALNEALEDEYRAHLIPVTHPPLAAAPAWP